MNNDLYNRIKDYLFDEVGFSIIRTSTRLYCEIAEYLYDEINITNYEDGDIIFDGNNESLQPMDEWRAFMEDGRKQHFCQASFTMFYIDGCFDLYVCSFPEWTEWFEEDVVIPANLNKEEFLKRFVVEMYKVEHKWNEYCDEIDAEQEED